MGSGKGRWISEFEASLVYRVSSRTARATQRNPVSEKNNKQQQQQKKTPNSSRRKVHMVWHRKLIQESHTGGDSAGHCGICLSCSSVAVVLKLSFTTPLKLNDPFTVVLCQVSCISDIYIMLHNSSKLWSWSEVATKIILWLGIIKNWGTVLKGCSIRKAENHGSRYCGSP